MIVQQIGYLKLNQVNDFLKERIPFSIYRTTKNTLILIKTPDEKGDIVHIFYPDKSRLEWKFVEGKRITRCTKVFDSTKQSEFETSGWNNGNQIMSYKPFMNW